MNENVKKLKTKISSKWHLNKTIIPLTLIGYEMITANCPIQCMHARRIIVKYIICMQFIYIYLKIYQFLKLLIGPRISKTIMNVY